MWCRRKKKSLQTGEIPGVEEEAEVEKATAVVVEPETDVVVMNPANNQNETSRQKQQTDIAREQQIDLDGKEISEACNLTGVNVARMDERITDVSGR